MSIWVLCPVYQDVASFLELKSRIIEEISAGDADGAAELRFVAIDDSAGQDPEMIGLAEEGAVEIVRPPFNLGHQRALVFALRRLLPRFADDDVIVTMDADGEDRPEDVPRLLRALKDASHGPASPAVLALRTKRRESLSFKTMYLVFRILFRALTGTTVRSGNFAAYQGATVRRVIFHPTFDLSYSSALLAVDLPVEYVPCERGSRYQGQSKMTFGKLSMHGLRMLMPFTDRIAIRMLGLFIVSLALGVILAVTVVGMRIFSDAAIPGWTSYTALGALVASLVALGNFVSLFVLFSQTRAVTLSNVEEIEANPSHPLSTYRGADD